MKGEGPNRHDRLQQLAGGSLLLRVAKRPLLSLQLRRHPSNFLAGNCHFVLLLL